MRTAPAFLTALLLIAPAVRAAEPAIRPVSKYWPNVFVHRRHLQCLRAPRGGCRDPVQPGRWQRARPLEGDRREERRVDPLYRSSPRTMPGHRPHRPRDDQDCRAEGRAGTVRNAAAVPQMAADARRCVHGARRELRPSAADGHQARPLAGSGRSLHLARARDHLREHARAFARRHVLCAAQGRPGLCLHRRHHARRRADDQLVRHRMGLRLWQGTRCADRIGAAPAQPGSSPWAFPSQGPAIQNAGEQLESYHRKLVGVPARLPPRLSGEQPDPADQDGSERQADGDPADRASDAAPLQVQRRRSPARTSPSSSPTADAACCSTAASFPSSCCTT